GTAGNRFLVGDVKQSIYRFRLADPRIFREYERRWREASPEGRSLPLSENFRSREALLEFINSLFRTLMRPAIGGVNYDSAAEMQFGDPERRAPLRMAATGSAQNHPPPARVEFHLLAKPGGAAADEEEDDPGSANDTADLDPVEKEARLIAHRL